MQSLKMAFKDEVRPNEYLTRVWATAFLVGAVLSGLQVFKGGAVNPANLLPLGQWQPRDPLGNLYIETWSTIAVNALQVGFGVWSAVLISMGIRRLFTSNKYVFACFSMGTGFGGLAMFLPGIVQPLLQMLVEKVPGLVN